MMEEIKKRLEKVTQDVWVFDREASVTEDIRALLAEIERLQKLVLELEEDSRADIQTQETIIHSLQVDNAQLRAALERVQYMSHHCYRLCASCGWLYTVE